MGEIGIAQVVLMGLVTVFVVLICLIIIIKLMGAIMGKAAPAEQAEAAVPAAPAAAPAVSGNKQQVVAAIAVAIAEEMGTDVSHIRIHSIKRV